MVGGMAGSAFTDKLLQVFWAKGIRTCAFRKGVAGNFLCQCNYYSVVVRLDSSEDTT